MRKPAFAICKQQSHRSAWAAAQSDQRLCCSLLRWYDMYTCYIQSFKILASFCSWESWFECYLVENLQRQVFAWCGSIVWIKRITISFEQPHDKTNKMACVPSEDSDQPGHPPSLIRAFAVRMKKAWVLSYLLSAQWRLWSDREDAQAHLNLHWAHSHFVGFVMRQLILSCKL